MENSRCAVACQGMFTLSERRARKSKAIADPMILETPTITKGSFYMGFICVLPSTERGSESILTIVDHYSKRPHSYLAGRLLLRLEWQIILPTYLSTLWNTRFNCPGQRSIVYLKVMEGKYGGLEYRNRTVHC